VHSSLFVTAQESHRKQALEPGLNHDLPSV